MKYYKYINEEGITCYLSGETTNSEYEEITEEEFMLATVETEEEVKPTYEELEQENAELLYQLLTGEELEQ